MNQNGQGPDFASLIVVAIGIIILLPLFVVLISMLHSTSCGDEISKISTLEGRTKSLEIDLQKAILDANFFKMQYETLRDHNITKQDFVDLKAQINDLNYQYTQINMLLFTLNQTIQQKYDIFSFSVGLNFLLLPLTLFTLFDIAFLNLKFANKTRIFLISITTRIREFTKGKGKREKISGDL